MTCRYCKVRYIDFTFECGCFVICENCYRERETLKGKTGCPKCWFDGIGIVLYGTESGGEEESSTGD